MSTSDRKRSVYNRWYKNNRTKKINQVKSYRKQHPDRAKQTSKRAYDANREARLQQKRAHYRANPELYKIRSAKYREANREKILQYQKAWRKKNREALKVAKRTRAYGLSREEQIALLSRPCRICGDVATDIDHCHNTKRVRGALCSSCNLGLGKFKDSITLLKSAICYLTTTP